MKIKQSFFLAASLILLSISHNIYANSPLIPITCIKTPCVDPKPSPAPFPQIIKYQVSSSGFQTGFNYQQMHVIKNVNDLSNLLAQITITGTIPKLNSKTEQLIAIFSGTNAGCPHSLKVRSVVDIGDTVAVFVTKLLPNSRRFCTAYVPIEKAYLMVTIPKTTKPISLITQIARY